MGREWILNSTGELVSENVITVSTDIVYMETWPLHAYSMQCDKRGVGCTKAQGIQFQRRCIGHWQRVSELLRNHSVTLGSDL